MPIRRFLLLAGLAGLVVSAAAQPAAPSAEALARRAKSIEKLAAEGVPYLADLPVTPDSTKAKLRSKEDIARRAVAVCITALKAERADEDLLASLVKRYKAEKFFTPDEKEFLENGAPPNEARNRYLWRYEGLVVLMWSLGYLDPLERPDANCDVHRVAGFLGSRPTFEQFLSEATPRSLEDILDQGDLNYRYQWAISDALRHGRKSPTGLERGVVEQRQAMFNWLIGR